MGDQPWQRDPPAHGRGNDDRLLNLQDGEQIADPLLARLRVEPLQASCRVAEARQVDGHGAIALLGKDVERADLPPGFRFETGSMQEEDGFGAVGPGLEVVNVLGLDSDGFRSNGHEQLPYACGRSFSRPKIAGSCQNGSEQVNDIPL